MPEKLIIQLLGEFSITYQGRTINDKNSRSRKLWTLLEYLVTFRDKVVTQDELIDLLWEDDETIENPANTLKTILYRVRALLDDLQYIDSKKIITYARGIYAFNPAIPVDVDIVRFERRYEASFEPGISDAQRVEHLLEAIDIYKGDFLQKSAHEAWVIPISAYYHSMYINAVLEASALLCEKGRWDEVLKICQQAVVVDNYTEPLHQYLIRALMETGHPQAAMSHYDYVTNLFFSQLGISPSPELSALYKLVKQTNNDTELDLSAIKNSLREAEASDGAFFCEYEFFKDLYRIEARTLARNGQSVCICLMTVSDLSGNKPTQKILNNAMRMLADAIRLSLRRGDIFTRYSVSQYLIMMSAASLEASSMVAERIVRRFKADHPKSAIRISHKIQPLDPVVTTR